MCSAKTIVGFYRRATEARKFSEDTDNPLKKRDFIEVERKWLALARKCKCNSENRLCGGLTVLVVSGNDSNAVIVHMEFSTAWLSCVPRPHP